MVIHIIAIACAVVAVILTPFYLTIAGRQLRSPGTRDAHRRSLDSSHDRIPRR